MKEQVDEKHKKQTIDMLAKHHGDGQEFVKLMEATFESRFNEEFWLLWERSIVPGLPAKPVVVDFGTGPGTFIKTLAKKYKKSKVYGVECAPYMLAAAGGLPENAEMVESDLQNPELPFKDNSVDVAVASVLVHEMIQPIRMFREIWRILKPGSKFYIYDWVRAPLETYLKSSDIDPFDEQISQEALEDLFVHFIEHNRFSLDDLKYMLTSMNFAIIHSGYRNEQQHGWLLAEKTA